MRRKPPRRESGFTLAELLTVIIIITVLAGLVVTALPKIEQHVKAAACASNLRQIGQAMRAFSLDHNGYYPALVRYDLAQGQPYNNIRIPPISDAAKSMNPWYYELMKGYKLDARCFLCPNDKNFDPNRSFELIKDKLVYMTDNISYGMNFDVKYSDGVPYRVNASGAFIYPSGQGAATPSGAHRYPDKYRADEIEDLRTFIVAADSNSEVSQTNNFAISIPVNDNLWFMVGSRHPVKDQAGGNVLFADDHVELWVSRTPTTPTAADLAKDINCSSQQNWVNRRYWTLAAD